MSFFDDEADEQPTRAARPRRPAGPRSRTAPSDAQQLMVRRAVALGVCVVILLILIFGIKGCLSSREKNALRDYNRNVAAVVGDSNEAVSNKLFALLTSGNGSAIELEQRANQILTSADEDVKRAKAISTPGDMRAAQEHLLIALTLRADSVKQIAGQVKNLGGDRKRDAVAAITGAMRGFLASDVIYSQRVLPYLQQTLVANGITGQEFQASQFLPDDTWLSVDAVGNRLGIAGAASSSSSQSSGPAAPGTHGHGLTSVKIGDTVLQPNGASNRVTVNAGTAFTVTFQNQGENNEFDVNVRITITGGPKTITLNKRVDETEAGQAAETEIRLGGQTPPLGNFVRVKVEVRPVKGEKTTDNNSQTYTVLFSR